MNASRLLLAAALALAGASAFALPDVHSAGNVEYMSGGIGSDESTAMLEQSHQWPLTLQFAAQTSGHADWMADVDVSVTDAQGRSVLHATSDGPLMLVRLAPGNYTVRASANGKVIERHVRVAAGHPAKAVFVWQGAGAAER
jgi:hypothetical protein